MAIIENKNKYHEQLRTYAINREPEDISKIMNLDLDWKNAVFGEKGDTVLHLTIHQNCTIDKQSDIISTLQIFLQRGVNPNVKNNEGKTAMHLAVKYQMNMVVEFLVKSGADLNVCDNNGDSLGHFLIHTELHNFRHLCIMGNSRNGHKLHGVAINSFIELLIRNGLNLNCQCKRGLTPLGLALEYGLQHIICTLLSYTDNLNSIQRNNQNYLHMTLYSLITFRKLIALDRFKSYDQIADYSKETVTMQAVKLLLDKGASVDVVDSRGNTPLHLAANLTTSDIIESLLENFTNVNARNSEGNTVLHIIIHECTDNFKLRPKHLEFVHILLFKGTDVHIRNNHGYSPLHIAVMRNSFPIMLALENYGADLSIEHSSGNLLHIRTSSESQYSCVKMKEAVIIEYLMDKMHLKINTRNSVGMTPLHLAIESGESNSAEKLIKFGANIHSRLWNEQYYTPLHMAALYNQDQIIEQLIKFGADVNARDQFGRTPLHISMRGNPDIPRLLLKSGAHVDLTDDQGILPLHLAVRYENFKVIEELLKFGADINDAGTLREIRQMKKRNIILYLLRQWYRLRSIGLPVAEEFILLIDKYETFDYTKSCLQEVAVLKTHFVGENLSLYDILHMDHNSQSAVVKDTLDLMDPFILRDQYPEYCDIILAVCHQAIERKPLIQPAIDAWYSLTGIYFLPECCVERIIAYLNNKDLRVMIEAITEFSTRKTMQNS